MIEQQLESLEPGNRIGKSPSVLDLEVRAVVCFVGFGRNSNRGFSIRNSGVDGEVGGAMSGCKKAGGTPALRNGGWGVGACGVWGGFAGEAGVLLREFLFVLITQRLR